MSEALEKEQAAERFLEMIQQSRRGKFKIYIGMSAGVGKTFRMLQEAHRLLVSGIKVQNQFYCHYFARTQNAHCFNQNESAIIGKSPGR